MPQVPPGLTAILEHAPLPTAALLSAAEQRPLLAAVSRRTHLPDTVIQRGFVRGAPLPAETAIGLVDRALSASTVRHVLHAAGERRPAVAATLIAHNVPAQPERQALLALAEPDIDEAVLANGRWPIDEQLRVARRVGGVAVLHWLAHLDPSVPVSWDDLAVTGPPAERLDADPVIALQALLRRPWLSEVPLERAGLGFRSAIATVTADERTLFRLLGAAQRLARFGRQTEAAGIIEAVACNPTAPLAVQRRCRRLARRIRCHYLADWRPAHSTPEPLWQADTPGQRRALDRLEQLEAVRHRTVWSAGLLAANPALAPDVAERVVAYLDRHLAAVDAGGSAVDVLADRLALDQDTRQRWHERCRSESGTRDEGHALPDMVEPLSGGHRSGGGCLLDDCVDAVAAGRAARYLGRAFGQDTDAWTIALLLLREGWDVPLADLPAVVGALAPAEEVPA